MKQLNTRVPQRLRDEIAVAASATGEPRRACIVTALIMFVKRAREAASLPPLTTDELLEDKPKPTESPL